ncbi:MAG: NERD domain-containing protein [Dysgonamonadaceae bacterium]|nr:NERD domain-containing protein [Dysgonamonadaceae bacterium]MDD4727699.1 NERD domain-containing protein [Dysgonamonadaceae bacterium]
MALIYGQIDSLKQIRNRLDSKGIDRFNSLNDFDAFLENYESEKTAIYEFYEKELDTEIFLLEDDIKYNNAFIDKTKDEGRRVLKEKIDKQLCIVDKYKEVESESLFRKTLVWLLSRYIDAKITRITIKDKLKLSNSIKKIERQVEKDKQLLDEYISNKSIEVARRSSDKIEKIAFIRNVVLDLKPFIAGAIGENLVVNEIKKLSDDYVLINDYSLRFNPPIYNRKKNDRIFSIQIDHLLISKAGIFILETKNWSRKSIQSLDMRSPIEQVRRCGYALYVLLNSGNSGSNIKLGSHHWGRRDIPVRSVVVMINEKPNEEFMHVKVKLLNELNGYVEFFDPIFSDSEFDEISKGVIDLYNSEYRNQRINT